MDEFQSVRNSPGEKRVLHSSGSLRVVGRKMVLVGTDQSRWLFNDGFIYLIIKQVKSLLFCLQNPDSISINSYQWTNVTSDQTDQPVNPTTSSFIRLL